jgi:cobalt-zinc-cadmium efflux system outer membrane protein
MKILTLEQLSLGAVAIFLGIGKVAAAENDALEVNAKTNVQAVSVETWVEEALAKNPENNFYRAEIEAAKAGLRTAGAWANPQVSGSIGQKSIRSEGLSAEGVAWSASVLQPFEWPGRIGLRKVIANREIELAELGYSQFRIALAGRVRLLAYNLWAAQAKAEAAREVADRFAALREVLVQRDPAGLTPLLETRIIESSELTFQRKTTEADLAKEGARLELNQLLGASPDARLVVSETPVSFRALEPREALLELARTNNFELRLRGVELAQQGFKVALAKNERYPALSVGPSISEERAGDRERIIGVGVSVPLPLWNRNQGNIKAAEARQMQAEASLLVTRRATERKVLEAALRYDRKTREMSKWQPDSVQHFKEAAEVADRHYRLGAVPIATYVDLQEKYLEAVEGLLETKKEALEAGQNLELLTGLTPPLVGSSTAEKKRPEEEKK